MQAKYYRPLPALQDVVETMMIVKNLSDTATPLVTNPFPPSPQQGLYFYLGDTMLNRKYGKSNFIKCPSVMLTGPQLKTVDLQMGHQLYLLYIGLRPGALHKLTGIPMYELVDTDLDAALAFGPVIAGLEEQLRNTIDDDHRIILVQQFLISKLNNVFRLDPLDGALRNFMSCNGNLPVDQVAKAACLSTRQLERNCNERLGIPPKLFGRLVRFSSAYRQREIKPQVNWNNIAFNSGYFDQMHLIRDFKEFTGGVPKLLEHQLEQTPYRLQSFLHIE
jgi:AraC-like DNA-binding protein